MVWIWLRSGMSGEPYLGSANAIKIRASCISTIPALILSMMGLLLNSVNLELVIYNKPSFIIPMNIPNYTN